MTCTTIPVDVTATDRSHRWMRRILGRAVGLFLPLYPRLEPDHMKRDLGFLDGRDPRYERSETR